MTNKALIDIKLDSAKKHLQRANDRFKSADHVGAISVIEELQHDLGTLRQHMSVYEEEYGRKFLCYWDPASFSNATPVVEGLGFFSVDVGYTDEDIEQIRGLEVNDMAVLNMGDHKVWRVA